MNIKCMMQTVQYHVQAKEMAKMRLYYREQYFDLLKGTTF